MTENTNPNAVDPREVQERVNADHGAELEFRVVRRILIDAYPIGALDHPVAY